MDTLRYFSWTLDLFQDPSNDSVRPFCDLKSSCPLTPSPLEWDVGLEADSVPLLVLTLRLYAALGLSLILFKCLKVRQAVFGAETCLAFLTFLVLSPVALLIAIGVLLVRRALTVHFERKYGGRVRLMSGNDAFWAYDSYANCCCFTALYVIQGKKDLLTIRDFFIDKVLGKVVDGEEIYGVFRNIATKKFGFYCWERAETIDPAHHIRYMTERETMTEAEVFEELSGIYDYPLRGDRPQFEILVVPDYVYSDPKRADLPHYAIIFRIHHSYMDGISAGYILANCLADTPPRLSVDPLLPIPMSLSMKVLGYLGLLFVGPRSLFRTLALNETNCFHGKPLSGPKVLGWSQPVTLSALKKLKDRTRTSTTAILVSALGGSLRSLALKKGLPVPELIHAFPTIAILPYPNSKPQNRFAVALFPMAIGLESSMDRLRAAYKSATDLARSPDVLFSYLTMKVTGILPAVATKFITDIAHATMLLTNVPGPAETTYLFGGDPLIDVGIWAPVRCGIGIGMGLFSYSGRVRASMVGDAAALPDPTDIPVLVQEFENEILLLTSQNDIPAPSVFWDDCNNNK